MRKVEKPETRQAFLNNYVFISIDSIIIDE